MTFINFTFAGFSNSFLIFWNVFTHGGWIAFVVLFGYILFLMYRDEIRMQFRENQEWMFFELRVPKENTTSLLAVEQIFSQWHALHTNFSFGETWIEGKQQLWYSLEMVSFGGKLSFIIRIPKRMRPTFESAIYAQYPNAELTEIEDYMKNISYDPEYSDFDVFGTEMRYTQDEAFPIKTYREFEHTNNPVPEEKIIDPLSGLFEALTVIEPHEFMGVQIIIQPLGDEEWKARSDAKAKTLKGEEPEHKFSFLGLLLTPFEAFANFKPSKLFEKHKTEKEIMMDKGNFMRLSEMEKERINQIERKAGKPGYRTKIRFMYLAPKDRFDKNKRSAITGGFRPFASINYNKLKPDLHRTWTGQHYLVSPTLEAPYIKWSLQYKKRRIFTGYKNRSIIIGNYMPVMNVEELATLYHLPITSDISSANIEKIESKKVQPPVNLPIG